MNNNDALAWDLSGLSDNAAAKRGAEQIASFVAAFHARLIAHGLTRDEATELAHTFLAGYFEMVQAQRQPPQAGRGDSDA